MTPCMVGGLEPLLRRGLRSSVGKNALSLYSIQFVNNLLLKTGPYLVGFRSRDGAVEMTRIPGSEKHGEPERHLTSSRGGWDTPLSATESIV